MGQADSKDGTKTNLSQFEIALTIAASISFTVVFCISLNWVFKFRKAFLTAYSQYLEQNEIEKAILNSQD